MSKLTEKQVSDLMATLIICEDGKRRSLSMLFYHMAGAGRLDALSTNPMTEGTAKRWSEGDHDLKRLYKHFARVEERMTLSAVQPPRLDEIKDIIELVYPLYNETSAQGREYRTALPMIADTLGLSCKFQ